MAADDGGASPIALLALLVPVAGYFVMKSSGGGDGGGGDDEAEVRVTGRPNPRGCHVVAKKFPKKKNLYSIYI